MARVQPPSPKPHDLRCNCTACRTRRREAQAEFGGGGKATLGPLDPPDGVLTSPDEALHADLVTVSPRMTARHRIAAWIAMRVEDPGISTMECSRRMGLAPKTLQGMISQAVKDGWLKFDDPLDRLEHEIIPKTMDNLASLLQKEDRQTTIEVAKGTIFRTYQAAKGISDAPSTILALKIETLDHDQTKVLTGHVVGKAKDV